MLGSGVGTSGGTSNWSSGFLPSTYQGVVFRSSGDPVLYLSNPPGVTKEMQRASLDTLKDLNEEHYGETGDMEIASRISSYELAFRMQIGRAGAARFLEGVARDAGDVRRERQSPPSSSPPTACWPAAWWSAACAS